MYMHKMSNFIHKPPTGWVHSENLIGGQGATYTVRYIGCLEVKISTKTLDFKTRSTVAKVCISRVSEAAGLKSVDKKRKIEKIVQRAIADTPIMDYAGDNVKLNISSAQLTLISIESRKIIACHDMPRISFASGGDSDTLDFVAYIAKDENEWRACYVLECGGGLAKDVIATIGQAFELRYKQSAKPAAAAAAVTGKLLGQACGGGSSSGSGASTSDADKDYYNDLPGKVPPDVAPPRAVPPPVPPLPITVLPFTTLPPVQSPNLIDLSCEVPAFDSCHHDYVNDCIAKERDVFDMQPFFNTLLPPKRLDPRHIAELQNEPWYHGQISRADAEKLLVNDGEFLVRESPNSEGQYVLSGIQDNMKKHLLLIDPDGVVRTKDRTFKSVSHLIRFHSDNFLPIISAESALVLRTPVLKNPGLANH